MVSRWRVLDLEPTERKIINKLLWDNRGPYMRDEPSEEEGDMSLRMDSAYTFCPHPGWRLACRMASREHWQRTEVPEAGSKADGLGTPSLQEPRSDTRVLARQW